MPATLLEYAQPNLAQPIRCARIRKFLMIPATLILATIGDLSLRCCVAGVTAYPLERLPLSWSERLVTRYDHIEFKLQAAYGCSLFLLLLLRCLTIRLAPQVAVSDASTKRWTHRSKRWNALATIAVLIGLLSPVPGHVSDLSRLM